MALLAAVVSVLTVGAVAPASSNAAPVLDPGPIVVLCLVNDTCGPSIDSGPAAGSTTNAPGAAFAFTRASSGALTPVIGFECRIDGGTFESCVSPKSYPSLTEGQHTFGVRARIGAFGLCGFPPHPCFPFNHNTNVATRTFTLDRTSPVIAFASGPAELSTINASSTDIGFSSTDATAVTFACSLDGAAFSACTSPKSLTGLGNGPHALGVKGTDAAGNVSTTLTRTFAVALPVAPAVTPPAPTITTKTVKKCKKVRVKKRGKVVRKKNGKIKYKRKCVKKKVAVTS